MYLWAAYPAAIDDGFDDDQDLTYWAVQTMVKLDNVLRPVFESLPSSA
jgi:hypothetical protein